MTLKSKIFVVEDEAVIAMEIQDHLSRMGHIVCGYAARGRDALEKIPAAVPDLIIMDINLAGDISGIDVAQEVRKTSSVPIIFLTAYIDDKLINLAAQTESYAYLIKPFQRQLLQANIEMALYKRRAEKKLERTLASLDETNKALDQKSRMLQHANSLLQAAFDATREGVLVISRSNETSANKIFSEQWRVPSDVIGDTKGLLPHLLEQCEEHAKLRSLFNLNEAPERVCHLTLNDQRHFEASFTPQHLDGQNIGRVISFRDITKSIVAELALRESEERYRVLFERSPDAILIIDSDGQIILGNRQAEKLFQYSVEELKSMTVEALIPEAKRAGHVELRERFTTGGKHRFIKNYPLRLEGMKKNGDHFFAEIGLDTLSANPNSGDSGSSTIAVVRDTTEREQALIRQKLLEAQLNQAQKMEAVGTLAGGIAHDFNNLLTAITLNTRLVEEDLEPTHRMRGPLQTALNAAARATELVRQILTFSRHESPNKTIAPLQPLVQEVSRLLRSTLPAGIQITLNVSPNAPPALIDSTRIHQLLMNLGTNAWRAIVKGIGEVQIALYSPVGLDSTASTRPRVRIEVSDNGVGMDAALLERVWDPFFTTRPFGEGSGLGLSVVHGIVMDHEGSISIHSTPGVGTTVRVDLPAAVPPRPPSVALEAVASFEEPLSEERKHVLYLDDEPFLTKTVQRILERIGYTPTVFTSAEEAITEVENNPGRFEVFISDLNMPKMSGLDVIQALKVIEPALPVILVSGWTDLNPKDFQEAGTRYLLNKPFSQKDLKAMLIKVSHARRARENAASPSLKLD